MSLRSSPAVLSVFFACLLGFGREAAASDEPQIDWTVGLVSVGFAIPGVVTAAGNGHLMGRGTKPSAGWRVWGFITGGVNVAVGGVYLGLIAPQGFGAIYAPALGFGLVNATVGLVDIALAASATAMSDSAFARVRPSVAPTAMLDLRGHLVPGVTASIRAF